ncbi:MAG: TetR/AcrR family transcriptional regulator [Acidobacteriota bacterium]
MTNPPSRPDEIIMRAIELAEDRGVTGVTTATLARRLGFTEAALYRYFPAKGAILGAALQHMGEELFSNMVLDLVPRDTESMDAMESHLVAHVRQFAGRQGLLLELLLCAASGRDNALQQSANAFLQEYTYRLVAYFGQLQELDRIDRSLPAEELARMWVCQLMGGFVRSRIALEHWDPLSQPGFEAFLAQMRQSAGAAADVVLT